MLITIAAVGDLPNPADVTLLAATSLSGEQSREGLRQHHKPSETSVLCLQHTAV